MDLDPRMVAAAERDPNLAAQLVASGKLPPNWKELASYGKSTPQTPAPTPVQPGTKSVPVAAPTPTAPATVSTADLMNRTNTTNAPVSPVPTIPTNVTFNAEATKELNRQKALLKAYQDSNLTLAKQIEAQAPKVSNPYGYMDPTGRAFSQQLLPILGQIKEAKAKVTPTLPTTIDKPNPVPVQPGTKSTPTVVSTDQLKEAATAQAADAEAKKKAAEEKAKQDKIKAESDAFATKELNRQKALLKAYKDGNLELAKEIEAQAPKSGSNPYGYMTPEAAAFSQELLPILGEIRSLKTNNTPKTTTELVDLTKSRQAEVDAANAAEENKKKQEEADATEARRQQAIRDALERGNTSMAQDIINVGPVQGSSPGIQDSIKDLIKQAETTTPAGPISTEQLIDLTANKQAAATGTPVNQTQVDAAKQSFANNIRNALASSSKSSKSNVPSVTRRSSTGNMGPQTDFSGASQISPETQALMAALGKVKGFQPKAFVAPTTHDKFTDPNIEARKKLLAKVEKES